MRSWPANPTLAALHQTLTDAGSRHRAGHRCDDGGWYNDAVRPDEPCPVAARLTAARGLADRLHAAVHDAAHNDLVATAVAEGMTGLVLADLPDDEREGWLLTGRLAIETLAAELDRDRALEARRDAVLQRLAATHQTP